MKTDKIKTIKDLARIAQVSVGAASMVMNNKWHKKVKPELAQRVLDIAKEYNYELNPLGRSLQKNQFFRVAIIMEGSFDKHPLFGAFSFHNYIGVIADKLNANGYSLDIIQLDQTKQEQIIKGGSFPKNVDAFFFLQWDTNSLQRLLSKVTPEQPFITLGHNFKKQQWSCIYRDTEEMSYQAIMHFIKNGHKRIAISKVTGSQILFTEKLAGYKRALKDGGIKFDPALLLDLKAASHSMEFGAQLAERFLDLPTPPTAFFCDDNIDAIGMLVHFQKEGWQIPEQLEVIGYGDEPLADMALLPLSYLKIPTREMADIAIEYILTALDNKSPVPPAHEKVAEKLIFQKTTRS